MKTNPATIVTFYSYKGGVGRSMALANVAWLLAKAGRKVLVIDWDLEAPGLHRFFGITDKKVRRGLIEIFEDYKSLLRQESGRLPENLVDLKKYVQRVKAFTEGGLISILPAGLQDAGYAGRINAFSWEEFYAKWHGFGFIEHLKEQLRNFEDADIVLVDSRTGVTDIGGICTLQLPDVVVILFAMNDQNIAGAKSVAQKISQKAAELEGRSAPPILILRPARVERSSGNQDKKIEWQTKAARELGSFIEERDPETVVAKKNIPYVSDFSYGETPLAVVKDPLSDMTDAFGDLADTITRAAESRGSNVPDGGKKSRGLDLASYLLMDLQLFLSRTSKVALLSFMVLVIALAVLSLKTRELYVVNQKLQSQIATQAPTPTATPTPTPRPDNQLTSTRPAVSEPGVLIGMASESQRGPATKLADVLRANGYSVALFDINGDTPPDTQVRYFWDRNKPEAQTILTIIQRDFKVSHSRVSRNVVTSPGRYYEIWFAKDAKLQPATVTQTPSPVTQVSEPEVYIEMASKSQRAAATKLADALRANGFVVPVIAVGRDTPPDTQVRYFWDGNQSEAQTILTIIQTGFRATPSSISLVPTIVSTRHYEIWLAKDAL